MLNGAPIGNTENVLETESPNIHSTTSPQSDMSTPSNKVSRNDLTKDTRFP